jgi:hypothetical protein
MKSHDIISCYFPGRKEGNHENFKLGWSVSESKFFNTGPTESQAEAVPN